MRALPRADDVVVHDEFVLDPACTGLVASGFEEWRVHLLDEIGLRVLLDTQGDRYVS